jgi:hypothetical protein
MEEGIDRQGMHTFWTNYVSKLKKKDKKGGVSMLQAPVVFVTSYFVLKMKSSMLYSFELCQRKQGSGHVYIREISGCYITFNSNSGIHILCAHYKYHNKECQDENFT